jgi:lysozyme family protein
MAIVERRTNPRAEEWFEYAVNLTFSYEGFLSDHPDDSGGLTKYGITQRDHPGVDIANLTKAQAKEIYYRKYWLGHRIQLLPDKYVAAEVFDTCVNTGTRGVRILQEACNLFGRKISIDGVIGTKETGPAVSAIVARYRIHFLYCLNGLQFEFYHSLYLAKPEKYGSFFKGWMKRLDVPAEARGA